MAVGCRLLFVGCWFVGLLVCCSCCFPMPFSAMVNHMTSNQEGVCQQIAREGKTNFTHHVSKHGCCRLHSRMVRCSMQLHGLQRGSCLRRSRSRSHRVSLADFRGCRLSASARGAVRLLLHLLPLWQLLQVLFQLFALFCFECLPLFSLRPH